jgi:hypothetical protein
VDKIWMTHPHLEGRKVQVPAASFQQRRRAGWEETDPPPPEPPAHQRETHEAPVKTAGASSLPESKPASESPKGRRSTRGEQ